MAKGTAKTVVFYLFHNNSMNQNEIDEIVQFVNKKYEEELPKLLKPVIKKRAKRLDTLKKEEIPAAVRKCTVWQLLEILGDARKNGKLNF